MLKIVLFDNSRQLENLSFIDDLFADGRQTTLVSPSPAIADEFESFARGISTITISRLINNQFEIFCPNDSIKKKADILLELSTIWCKIFSGKKIEEFFQIYDLLSELRSFTLNFDLVAEIVEKFDETTAKAIKIFWNFFDDYRVVDEHKSYQLLINALANSNQNQSQNENRERLIFAGFNFFSGVQIDYLRAVGQKMEIFLLLPKEVFEGARASDWPMWLSKDDDNISFITLESEKEKKQEKIVVAYFLKNQLSLELSKQLAQDRREHIQKHNIVLATSDIGLDQINELATGELYFKTASKIFEHKMQEVFEFFDLLIFKNNFKNSSRISLDFYNQQLEALINSAIQKEDYRKLKVLLTLKETVYAWSELSVQNLSISRDENKLFESIVLLDLPRNNHVNFLLSDETENGKVISIAEYNVLDGEAKNIVCVTSAYQKISSTENIRFDEQAMSVLAAIGPIKNRDFENKIIRFKLKEILTSSHGLLLMERSIPHEVSFWREIMDSFFIEEVKASSGLNNLKKEKQLQIIPAPSSEKISASTKKFSASRLQTYLECPRKYYFKYIDRIEDEVVLTKNLTVAEIGTMEHEVISACFNENNFNLSLMVEKILSKFEKEKMVELDLHNRKKIAQEILIYAQNGIDFLVKLKDIDPTIKFSFARKIQSQTGLSVGEIDCLLYDITGKICGIVDFKRGPFSIPSEKELMGYEEIQIWFYLKAVIENKEEIDLKNLLVWGYLCLSDVEKSLIYSTQKERMEKIFEVLTIKSIDDNWQKVFEQYFFFEQKKREQCLADDKMLAIPANENSCSFCVVNNFCENRI